MKLEVNLNTIILITMFLILEFQLLWFKKKKKIKKAFRYTVIITLNRFFSLLPLDKNRVLFISDIRENIGNENLGYMYNYIPDTYKKVVSCKADRRVKRNFKESLKLIYNISIAKYILLDDLCRTTSYIRVRRKQQLVQLWHGAGAFKKFGYSRSIEKGGDLKSVHPGYKKYTKAIVSSKDIRACYAEAFAIDIKKIQATGFPRTDMFFDKKLIKEKVTALEEKYPFIKNKKVILFAPTYRGTPYKNVSTGRAYYDFSKLDLEEIYNQFKDNYVFIFKWHPALYNNITNHQLEDLNFEKYADFYYDLSNERDINDLLLISDILITDYSSVIFDWAFLNRPIIYFTYDLQEYEAGRGLYFPFNDYVYGDVVVNTNELIKSIRQNNLCKEERKKFFHKFLEACDGKSTEKTYQYIFEGKVVNDDDNS